MYGTDTKILKDLVVTHIDVDGDYILIETEGGRRFQFYHAQDCCESVSIYDTKGDLRSLLNKKLIGVEMREYHEDPEDVVIDDTYRDSYTWTDVVFRTTEDTIICRWLGESNGYYSESVNFEEISG